MTITTRLFLAILLACAVVVTGMTLMLQWSVDRGFLRYVNIVEQERIDTLGDALAEYYRQAGGWQDLSADRDLWHSLIVASRPERSPRPGRSKRDPDGRDGFAARLLLLDRDGIPVVPARRSANDAVLHDIVLDGRIIGRIGIVPRRQLAEQPERLFLSRQKFILAGVAVGMLGIAALLSFLLARRFLKPIDALAGAARRLAGGDYRARVAGGSGDEFGRLCADFNALALALEKHESARREWIADISHELRTPLAVLRGEIEALRDGVRPTTPAAIASLHGESLRLQRLVDDLHQLALSDLGALNYRMERIDLGDLLRELFTDFAPRLQEAGIAVTLEIPQGRLPLLADRDRLGQLFANLLENTLKYTDAGGRAVLRLTRSATQLIVELADSAPGVPPSALPRLFERLFRVESSRNRATGGAGLGLSICRSIAEAHGGTIAAEPSPLGGLAIRVTLPAEESGR